MSFVNGFIRLFTLIKESIQRIYLLIRYDNSTIINYYRKQGAQIGDNCRIDIRTKWPHASNICIGNHVFVARDVMFHTYDGGAWILREEQPDIIITDKIIIEDNCLIGAFSHLFPNIRIGKNSIVAVGSVVNRDIPPNSIAMGVPARVIGSTLKYKDKHISIWNEQLAAKEQQRINPNLSNH